MKTLQLDTLARQHGIGLTRPSPDSAEVPISDEAKRKVLAALGVDVTAPSKDAGEPGPMGRKRAGKIPKSYLPPFLETTRVWGISLQLYELRSARNWGIGDFEDLKAVAALAGEVGADFIGLNPLHAPFLANPERCSPYEPSNRQMLNPLYIAVDTLPGFVRTPDIDKRLDELRQTELVDYRRVAEIKLETLRELWRRWLKETDGSTKDFEAFVAEEGEGLRLHALFEALSAHLNVRGMGTGWRTWPAAYQRPETDATSDFAREHADDIRFHMWLQWLAHRQLTAAADAAREAGLRIGLYLDLAVGEAIDGSATWSERNAYIAEATVGSPPDPFAADGQDWRLAALHPSAIAAGQSSPYHRMIRAAMRYAGAIRIDHAAALRRLFLVPLDSQPENGAYVDYPEHDLLRILSVLSARYQCLVIGEDLGILPKGLQRDLERARILSYRILSYERGDDHFKPAHVYPQLALACISTHDHQTLDGWWRAADIEARDEHGILPPDMTKRHLRERINERRYLQRVLREAGAYPPKKIPSPTASDDMLDPLVVSAHRFIAKTPSLLAAVRLADMTGQQQPTNIPGTSDSYPNWKPKLSVPIEKLTDLQRLRSIAETLQTERPRADRR